MKVSKSKLLACLLSLSLTSTVMSYDIVDRMKLIDDKLKTQEMLRPLGHDFFIDVGASFSSDTLDLIDDAERIGELDNGSSDTSAQISQADTILEEYYNKENIVRARVQLGLPIFSFNAFGFKWKPNLRVDGGLTAIITPRTESLTFSQIVDNLDQIPAEVRNFLSSCDFQTPGLSEGDDMLAYAVTNCSLTQAQADLIKATYGIDSIPYLPGIDTTALNLPVFDNYVKIDVKAGTFWDWTKDKHWFGQFALYVMGRADIRKKIDATFLIAGGGDLGIDEPNTLMTTNVDARVGYKNSNYSVMVAAEELKLFENSSEPVGKPAFGTSPLLRLHGQADYKLSIFSVHPFIGSHARSGYGFGDAYYFGSDFGAYVWGDRLGLRFRFMLDKEHLTMVARAKLWLMQLEIMQKSALKDEVDGVKVNNQLGVNLRFMI